MGLISHHHHDNSSQKAVCNMPRPLRETPTDPVVGGLSFYHLNMAVAGACAAFSCISIFALMVRHATHLSNPNEQLKIMRICAVIPAYAILSFVAIAAPAAFAYVNPWIDVFQAVALGDFFLLMSEYITPDAKHRDLFLSALVIPQKKKGRAPLDGVSWYRKRWIAIFQYVVVSLLVAVVTDITEGANVYCLESSDRHFAHLWLNIIHTVSLVVAVVSVLGFYQVLKGELASHRPLAKLLAFKLIVSITFLIHIIYWILSDLSSSPLSPTAKMNYADIRVGVPLLVVCITMVPFSIFFHWAYSVTPYLITSGWDAVSPAADGVADGRQKLGGGGAPRHGSYQGGRLGYRAWLALLNPSEIIQAVLFAFKMAAKTEEREGIAMGRTGRGGSGPSGGRRTHDANVVYQGQSRTAGDHGAAGVQQGYRHSEAPRYQN